MMQSPLLTNVESVSQIRQSPSPKEQSPKEIVKNTSELILNTYIGRPSLPERKIKILGKEITSRYKEQRNSEYEEQAKQLQSKIDKLKQELKQIPRSFSKYKKKQSERQIQNPLMYQKNMMPKTTSDRSMIKQPYFKKKPSDKDAQIYTSYQKMVPKNKNLQKKKKVKNIEDNISE